MLNDLAVLHAQPPIDGWSPQFVGKLLAQSSWRSESAAVSFAAALMDLDDPVPGGTEEWNE